LLTARLLVRASARIERAELPVQRNRTFINLLMLQLQQAALDSVLSVGTQHALCSPSPACFASGMQHALFSPLRFAFSP
jgi:hypothetical protein